MKRGALMGTMIGTMAGIALAMGVHTLFYLHPPLGETWLAQLLVLVSTPGARLLSLLSGRPLTQELGIVFYWLSLQLTLVGGGALCGCLAGALWRRRSRQQGT